MCGRRGAVPPRSPPRKNLQPQQPDALPEALSAGIYQQSPLPVLPQPPRAASPKTCSSQGGPHVVPACPDNSEGPFQLQSSLGGHWWLSLGLNCSMPSCFCPSLPQASLLRAVPNAHLPWAALLGVCFLDTQPGIRREPQQEKGQTNTRCTGRRGLCLLSWEQVTELHERKGGPEERGEDKSEAQDLWRWRGRPRALRGVSAVSRR